MTTTDDFDQPLWDYVFGLLDPDEAKAIEARITSDHAFARAYAEIRQAADLLEAAARVDAPQVELRKPAEAPITPAPVRLNATGSHRFVMMFLSSAALVLAGLVGYTWFTSEALRDAQAVARAENVIAANYKRVVLTGPARLQAADNLYTVRLEDVKGVPAEAAFGYSLVDSGGQVLAQATQKADVDGNGTILIDGTKVAHEAKLKVWCDASGEGAAATLELARAEARFDTSLALDRDIYFANDLVQFRVATQPADGAARELSWNYTALNSLGEPVGESMVATTRNGVANGSIALPADAPIGRYSLWAANPTGEASTVVSNFYVVRTPADAWQAEVALHDWDLSPGKVVNGEVVAALPSGKPLAGADVKLSASVNGKAIEDLDDKPLRTDDNGRALFRLAVPDDATDGTADLSVTLQKDKYSRTLVRSIQVVGKDAPQNPDPGSTLAQNVPAQQPAAQGLNVQFYPEGGPLVAGVPNQVYLWAEWNDDPSREVLGKIVDSRSRTVVDGIATQAGRAKFAFTPQDGEIYSFQCETPNQRGLNLGKGIEAPLPPADETIPVKLSALKSVLGSDEPLQVEVAAVKTPAQLVVSANAGDQLVGQQYVDFDSAKQSGAVKQRVSVPLTEKAAGLVGVSLYDVESNPPRLISQRLVYREPSRRWNIELTPSDDARDDIARLSIQVRDERGNPAQAMLGINVQRDSGIEKDETSAILRESLVENELLLKEDKLDRSQQAELDLALGIPTSFNRASTQNRLGNVPLGGGVERANSFGMSFGSLATSGGNGGFGGQTAPNEASAHFALAQNPFGLAYAPQPPAIVDNLPQVEAAYRQSIAAWRQQQEHRWQAFALAIAVGSCILIFASLTLAVFRLADRYLAWMPALATGVAALVIGGLWLRTDLDRPVAIALRPLAAYRGEQLIAESLDGGSGGLGGNRFAGGGLGGGGSGAMDLDAIQPVPQDQPATDPGVEEPASRPIAPEATATAPVVPLLPRISDPKPVTGEEELAAKHRFYFAKDRALDDLTAQPGEAWFKKRYLSYLDDIEREDLGVQRKLYEGLTRLDRAPTDRFGELGDRPRPTGSPTTTYAPPSPTLYWNPALQTDAGGKAEVQFAAPTPYRITIEASGSGRWGRLERVIGPPAKSP